MGNLCSQLPRDEEYARGGTNNYYVGSTAVNNPLFPSAPNASAQPQYLQQQVSTGYDHPGGNGRASSQLHQQGRQAFPPQLASATPNTATIVVNDSNANTVAQSMDVDQTGAGPDGSIHHGPPPSLHAKPLETPRIVQDISPGKEPPVPEQLATRFNWTKGKLIGQGAFGRVFQGLDNDSGHILAVKQVAVTKDETLKGRVTEHIRALEAEVAVLRQLNHRNIVRYLGTERTDDTLNIFLEYVPGGSIASLIEKFGPLQENVVRKYTQQILQGLEYLHQKKIMHRDIKGANILVDPQGTVKLADFGASRKIEDLATVGSGSKSIRGTPYWMAPEVIKQTGHGRPADIWSLGCVVIEMATGKPPWSNCNTQVAAMFYIASTKEPPPLPENLSSEARDFLLLCFNRVPKDRPNATRLLRHPWLANIPGPSSSLASSQVVTASTSMQRPPTQQRHPLVPLLPLQHALSPPSPIKEESETARSVAPNSSLAPNSHRASNLLPASLHMPLAIGPLEQGRRQSLMSQTAASLALTSGLPPLAPAVRASAAVSQSMAQPPAASGTIPAAAPADTLSPGASPAPAPAPPPPSVTPPRLMTPIGTVPEEQYDTIVSPSSIPAALQAAAAVAAAQPAQQPAPTTPQLPAAALEAAAVHSRIQDVRASMLEPDLRQSMLTLDYNPIQEPSWMPQVAQQKPVRLSSGGTDVSGGLACIHEGCDSLDACTEAAYTAARAARSASSSSSGHSSINRTSGQAAGGPASQQSRSQPGYATPLHAHVDTGLTPASRVASDDLPDNWCQTLDPSNWGSMLHEHQQAGGTIPVLSPGARSVNHSAGGAAGSSRQAPGQQPLVGVADPDPVRQSKMQRWREELSAELDTVRKQRTAGLRSSSSGAHSGGGHEQEPASASNTPQAGQKSQGANGVAVFAMAR